MSMPFDMLWDREPILTAQNLLKELTRSSGIQPRPQSNFKKFLKVPLFRLPLR